MRLWGGWGCCLLSGLSRPCGAVTRASLQERQPRWTLMTCFLWLRWMISIDLEMWRVMFNCIRIIAYWCQMWDSPVGELMRNTCQPRFFFTVVWSCKLPLGDPWSTWDQSLQLPLAPSVYQSDTKKGQKESHANSGLQRKIQRCSKKFNNTQTADKKEPVGPAWRETRASPWKLTWGQSVSARTWGQGSGPGDRAGRGCIFSPGG